MNLCTIIIINRNYAQYIAQAIESALNQTVKCDVVVHDDYSTDASTEAIAKYIDRCHVTFGLEHEGIVSLRNYAANRAETEWICMLDSDDWLEKNYVERCLEAIVDEWDYADPTVGVIYPNVRFRTGLIHWRGRSIVKKAEFDKVKRGARQHGFIYGCSLFRKRCWEHVGGYRECEYEDYDFFIRVQDAGWGFRHADTHFNYRKHKGSRSPKDSWEAYLIAKKIRENNHGTARAYAEAT
jgi:glycosyltransferase involved in cell wall biosynthesis